jgi:hypothetical protein
MKKETANDRTVPEQVVEASWREIGGFSEEQARREIGRISRAQPALLAFVTSFSQDLGSDAQQLGVYMFVVIMRMFEKHFGKRLQNVGPKRIERIHDETVEMLDRLAKADERWIERAAVVEAGKQPWVWKYVTECLFEPDDEEMELSEDDQGALALIMRTVIDALDGSVR